jgi:hypothetical protein
MNQPLAYFVQFPHPGEEHRPRGDRMPWNVGDHKRKFLMTPGRYIDLAGEVSEADLVCWAEWEPPPEVVATWPQERELDLVLLDATGPTNAAYFVLDHLLLSAVSPLFEPQDLPASDAT